MRASGHARPFLHRAPDENAFIFVISSAIASEQFPSCIFCLYLTQSNCSRRTIRTDIYSNINIYPTRGFARKLTLFLSLSLSSFAINLDTVQKTIKTIVELDFHSLLCTAHCTLHTTHSLDTWARFLSHLWGGVNVWAERKKILCVNDSNECSGTESGPYPFICPKKRINK